MNSSSTPMLTTEFRHGKAGSWAEGFAALVGSIYLFDRHVMYRPLASINCKHIVRFGYHSHPPFNHIISYKDISEVD